MAGSYKFAILRFAPLDARQESVNIGVAVFERSMLKVFVSKGLEKLRVLSKAIDVDDVSSILDSFCDIDKNFVQSVSEDFDARCKLLDGLGPVRIGTSGSFSAASAQAYENRVSQLLRNFVDPEPARRKLVEKRSRVLADIKRAFRSQRVLAQRNEDLSSHRIVPSFYIDEGLTADFVLKNGAFHVTETVDASRSESSLRKLIGDVGTSTLVLERAKMSFQNEVVKSLLVYTAAKVLEKSLQPSLDAAEHLGIRLVNWDSENDRNQYIAGLVSLATPIERKRYDKTLPIVGGSFKFH